MADVYLYADETGDPDMSGAAGTSTYFGFGTAVFEDDHGQALWEGQELRCHVERKGVRIPKGFHAKNDSHATREEVFATIANQAPRFDTTFLYKARAFERVKMAGKVRLYKLAWYLHFRALIDQISVPGDTVYVIAANLTLRSKYETAHDALNDVCNQFGADREIVLCVWDSPSAWGLQVADYGLWASQRILEDRNCAWFDPVVKPNLRTAQTPWGMA